MEKITLKRLQIEIELINLYFELMTIEKLHEFYNNQEELIYIYSSREKIRYIETKVYAITGKNLLPESNAALNKLVQ